MSAPFILTLRLDHLSSQFFDDQRRRYFPPGRNFLASHVTLFHHLPSENGPAIHLGLQEASAVQVPFEVAVEGLRFLGKGVAYRLASAELAALRAGLAKRWADMLTPQDRQKFQPHVTVQNKVAPAEAQDLFASLSAGFAPWNATAIGLDLWEYRGGPWAFAGSFPFAP